MRLIGMVIGGLFLWSGSSLAGFIKIEGIEDAFLFRVYVSNLDDNLIYAASANTLFKSNDGGKSWKKVYILKGETVKDLYVDKQLYDTVYLASDRGVYKISQEEVEKIFSLPPEVESKDIEVDKGVIYLGTTQGIYYSGEDFLRWKKLDTPGDDIIVYSIGFSPPDMLVATNLGLYVGKEGKSFRRVLVLKELEGEEEEETKLSYRVIKPDRYNKNIIYLATSEGLFLSSDKGESWSKVHIPLIDNVDIRALSQPSMEKNTLYLATDRGVISVNLEKSTSKTIFEGLPTKQIFWLDFNRKGNLFVATNRGLYFKPQFTESHSSSQLEELLKKEPSIFEVQQAGLRYNDVHPEKIEQWRRTLKYRALFPSITLDYDKTINYDSGSDRYYIGPRDWGVTISWDIGDLLWNSYEDDVDTRSRLNTQLRNSILDDINTIYFERLRVKMALMDPALSEQERLKKQLRLRELTASLDGYTGGYFSKRLKELQEE